MAVEHLTRRNVDGTLFGQVPEEKIGFYGIAAPIAQQTLAAAATDAATNLTLTNEIRSKLILTGLFRAA